MAGRDDPAMPVASQGRSSQQSAMASPPAVVVFKTATISLVRLDMTGDPELPGPMPAQRFRSNANQCHWYSSITGTLLSERHAES